MRLSQKEEKLRDPSAILVTGATGKQGGAVLRGLARRGHAVKALLRDPDKGRDLKAQGVEVAVGDLNDMSSLCAALQGIKQVFLVTSPSYGAAPSTEIQQGLTMIDAAIDSGVEHIVFTSSSSSDRQTGIVHLRTSTGSSSASGAPAFRSRSCAPVFFMENFATPFFLPSIRQGVLALPMRGDRPLQMISVEDIGEVGAAALANPAKFASETIELAGDELTLNEAMALLSKATGKTIRYEQLTPAIGRQVFGDDMTLMFRWFDEVGYRVDIPELQRRWGAPLTTFAELMKTAAWVRSV
jgi:uncharacterized protein YbjT (DUF2867 family)